MILEEPLPTDVYTAINNRRAIREYTTEPIAQEVLDRVVSAALEAPSAFNLQLRDVVVVRDPEVKQALTDSSQQPQFAAADTVLVFVARAEAVPDDAAEILPADYLASVEKIKAAASPAALRENALKDAMLAAGFALVAASAEGLATSPTTGWDEEKGDHRPGRPRGSCHWFGCSDGTPGSNRQAPGASGFTSCGGALQLARDPARSAPRLAALP